MRPFLARAVLCIVPAALALLILFHSPVAQAQTIRELVHLLSQLERDIRGEIPRLNRRELGLRIHGLQARIWHRMAAVEGSAITNLGRTFLGQGASNSFGIGEHEHVYVDGQGNERRATGPRIEVWIEKKVGPDGKMRADRVVIDHESRRVVVSDITTRHISDPTLQPGTSAYTHALEHDGTNRIRAGEIETDLRNRGIHNYDVMDQRQSNGEHYETAMRRIVHEQSEEEGRRRRIAANAGSGDAGGRAAKGVIGAMVVSIAIGVLLPSEITAAEARRTTTAQDTFRKILRLYLSGRPNEADAELAQWRRYGDDLIFAQSMFPWSDLGAVALLDEIIIPSLREVRESTAPIADDRRACMDFIANVERRIRDREAGIAAAADKVRRAFRDSYNDLTRRIRHWETQLLPAIRQFRNRRSTSPVWGDFNWNDLRPWLNQESRKLFDAISIRQRNAAHELGSSTPEEVASLARSHTADLGETYFKYWQFASKAVQWSQHAIIEQQRAEKAIIAARYQDEIDLMVKETPNPTPRQWMALRDRMATQEALLDRQFVNRIERLYASFVRDTKGMADSMKTSGALEAMVREMSSLAPSTAMGRLTKELYATLDILTYRNVPDDKRHYRDDASIRAQPLIESIFGREAPTQGEIALMAVWINNVQAAIDDLENEVREGSKLTFWADLTEGDHPGEHDMPVGPPPAGSLAARQITWTLPGGSPAIGSGHVFRTQAPTIEGDTPRTIHLRASRPGSADLEKRIVITPNGKSAICLTMPDQERMRAPVPVKWTVTDTDPKDELTVRIKFNGGKVMMMRNGTGYLEGPAFRPGERNELVFTGASAEGRAIVTWPQAGDYSVAVMASDGLDEQNQEYPIKITGNVPPRITILAIVRPSGKSRFEIGEEFELHYSSRDPDIDEILEYRIIIPNGGLEILRQNDCVGTPAQGFRCSSVLRGLRHGNFTINVSVKDISYGMDRKSMRVTIGEPDDCSKIDCDCPSIDMGLGVITREYRRDCRSTERALKQQCAQTGKINGTCHATAQGPNAWPR